MEKIGTQLDRLPFHFLPIVRERGNHLKLEKKKIQQSNNGRAYSWGGNRIFAEILCWHNFPAILVASALGKETSKFFSPKNQ